MFGQRIGCACACCPSSDASQQTTPLTTVGSMLVRRLRRRPNIEPTLIQCLVFAGMAWSALPEKGGLLSESRVGDMATCRYIRR